MYLQGPPACNTYHGFVTQRVDRHAFGEPVGALGEDVARHAVVCNRSAGGTRYETMFVPRTIGRKAVLCVSLQSDQCSVRCIRIRKVTGTRTGEVKSWTLLPRANPSTIPSSWVATRICGAEWLKRSSTHAHTHTRGCEHVGMHRWFIESKPHHTQYFLQQHKLVCLCSSHS